MRSSSLHISGINPGIAEQELAALKESIIRTLVYFDIFQYPLTATEIRSFLDTISSEVKLLEGLTELLKEKKIFLQNGFFSVQDNPLLGIRRKEGNQRAEKLLIKARRIGRFLYRFPFVKAIGISGSLSKNFADEKSDIDFFIITKANRLWIARTLMHLYKKFTFLTGRQHFHCMNYYIDEKALQLTEQNIFTAIEIKTLDPVSGSLSMNEFFDNNAWSKIWLPAFSHKKQQKKEPRFMVFKPVMEWLFKGKPGNTFDNFLWKWTQKRWVQKEAKGKKNSKGQTMGLISDKHFARSNPGNFQEKVLALYKKKLGEVIFSST